MQNHKIFEQFHDFCSIRPGEDKPWTVGTEHRQLQIYEPEFETAKAMKQMMVDHLKRRYFIIDANISVSIMLSDTRTNFCQSGWEEAWRRLGRGWEEAGRRLGAGWEEAGRRLGGG